MNRGSSPKLRNGSHQGLCNNLKINHSTNGILTTPEELIEISDRFFQMYEVLVLGCKDPELLKRYQGEKEMYTACDIVIDLIDCAFWQIFAKDEDIINRLAKQFKNIEFLTREYEDR